MNNVEITYLGKETRAAIIMDDVAGAELFNVKVQKAANAPRLILTNSRNIKLDKVNGIPSRTIDNGARLILQ
jgi:hypothetical protein